MRNHTILDPTFDIQITSSYHLAVQISPQNLSYVILDTVRMKFLAFKNVMFGMELEGEELYSKIANQIRTEGYLNRNFRHLSLYYSSPKASLIPAEYFNESKKESLADFLGPSSESQVLLHRYCKNLDAYLLFEIPKRIHSLTENGLDAPGYFHQSIPLIENAIHSSKGKANFNRIYAQVNPGFIDLVVVKAGKLVLYNSFHFKTEKDLAFYVLYVFDQFKLSTKQTTLEICGFTDESDEYVQLLRSYIREIVFQEFNRSFSYSLSFNELAQHHFSNLINLFRCE